LGFSGNVRLEITAPNLVVRIQIIGRSTDNPDPHRGQPDPDEPIAPAQRGPRRRLVHGERLAQGEVLKSELAVAAAEERAESEPVEQRADHGTAIVSRSEPKDQPLVWPDGVLAKARRDDRVDAATGRRRIRDGPAGQVALKSVATRRSTRLRVSHDRAALDGRELLAARLSRIDSIHLFRLAAEVLAAMDAGRAGRDA
jgi:hypothetical protein